MYPEQQNRTGTLGERLEPRVPQLAEGMELIGEYEGSGFKETPYLARRMDGQVLQLTRLLYLVADAVDGERDFDRIAEKVTEDFGRTVSADNIEFLVKNKLRPLGVLAAADGTSPKLKKATPMLALNFRTKLVPERVVYAITTLFYPLFHWPIVLFVLGGLVALDAWLFFVHGVAQSARDIAYQPALFLMIFGLVVISAAFHECGHATACRYGGAKPGAMGAGIYLVYPAFFSDVTDVYRLGKWGRIRTDLGGIYFNMIFSLLTAGAYFLTGFEPLLAIIVIQHLEMLHQLLPFLRLDGYYVMSDITGVPDLFARIRPILSSLVPWREADASVTALKPWVRVIVTAWVLSVVPILLYLLATIFVAVPRLVATAWDSLLVQYDKATSAFSDGEILATVAAAIQMIFLVLPLAGLAYTFGLLGKKLGMAAWARTEGKPVLRSGLASVALVSFGLLTVAWWPSEIYEPIQPGERGALQDSLKAMSDTAQESLKTLDELEKYVPEVVRPSLADELQDGLETVEEYVPAAVRPSLTLESREGQDDDPATDPAAGEQPGSPAGTGASGPDASTKSGASGTIQRIDKPVPSGEQQSDAQQSDQDAGTADEQPDSPAEIGASGPIQRIDKPVPEGEQPSSQPAEDLEEETPTPVPTEPEKPEATPVNPVPPYVPQPSTNYPREGYPGDGYSGYDRDDSGESYSDRYSGGEYSGRFSGDGDSGYGDGYDDGDSGYRSDDSDSSGYERSGSDGDSDGSGYDRDDSGYSR
ncbi:MAG: hypothetical protein M3122_05585 [Actinomycetota bacterium]|nr:hypothetical protein [Actinomycetota bacterium]